MADDDADDDERTVEGSTCGTPPLPLLPLPTVAPLIGDDETAAMRSLCTRGDGEDGCGSLDFGDSAAAFVDENVDVSNASKGTTDRGPIDPVGLPASETGAVIDRRSVRLLDMSDRTVAGGAGTPFEVDEEGGLAAVAAGDRPLLIDPPLGSFGFAVVDAEPTAFVRP